VALADAYIVSLSLRIGDLKTAEDWSIRRSISLEDYFSIRFVFEGMAQARFLYLKGMYQEALWLMEKLRDSCKMRNMYEAVLEMDILLSATLDALNSHDDAKALLSDTLLFAEKHGYIRPFVNEWPFISHILLDIAKSSYVEHKPSHLHTVLEASGILIKSGVIKKQSLNNNKAGLTPREIEILQLISSGFSNKEIADMKFIALDTVKTHVRHIFEKLNVKNRVHATLKAKEINLLK
jgi:LuxR family maltose regulon positive regulatory protein